jgi:hypothetical protein
MINKNIRLKLAYRDIVTGIKEEMGKLEQSSQVDLRKP